MSSNKMSRRTFLGVAAGVAAGLAGCSMDPGPGGQSTEQASTTTRESETPTEVPSGPIIWWVPERNQELREAANKVEDYIQEDEFRTESVIFRDDIPKESSHERSIDLAALEWWHDNDFPNLSEDNLNIKVFVESIDGLTTEEAQEIISQAREQQDTDGKVEVGDAVIEDAEQLQKLTEEAKKQPKRSSYGDGKYDQEEALKAESAKEFLDQVHPYLFNLEWNIDTQAISTEDEQFAAALQEAADTYLKGRNGIKDVETTFWGFDLPKTVEGKGGGHGNGLVYDHTNDELRVMETIVGAETATDSDRQLHPLIEDSNYLDTEDENDADEMYWHPLRFDGTAPETDKLDFKQAKLSAATMIDGLATAYHDSSEVTDGILNPEMRSVGLETGYLRSIVEAIRNYNDRDDVSFEAIKDQAKAYEKLQREEGNYGIGGTFKNPVYVELDSQYQVNHLMESKDATLNDYVEVEGLGEVLSPETTETTVAGVDSMLSGQTAA